MARFGLGLLELLAILHRFILDRFLGLSNRKRRFEMTEPKSNSNYCKNFELDIYDMACFHCPLSFEDPPRDCNWGNSKGTRQTSHCPFQVRYAREHGVEE